MFNVTYEVNQKWQGESCRTVFQFVSEKKYPSASKHDDGYWGWGDWFTIPTGYDSLELDPEDIDTGAEPYLHYDRVSYALDGLDVDLITSIAKTSGDIQSVERLANGYRIHLLCQSTSADDGQANNYINVYVQDAVIGNQTRAAARTTVYQHVSDADLDADKMKCIAQFHDELTSVQWLRSVRIAVMAQAIDWCERVAAQYHLEDEGTNVLYIEDARQFLHLTPSPTAWDADEITKWLAEHFTTKYHLTVVALGLTEEEDEAYFLHRFETVGALYPYRVA